MLAVGAAAVLLTGDDGDGPGDSTARSTGDGWVDASRSNPYRLATDGKTVCATGISTGLYCLDATTGDERFAVELRSSASASPTIARNLVLVGDDGNSGQDGLYAYSLDGEPVWTARIEVRAEEHAPLHVPVVGETVAVIDDRPADAELVGTSVATGEERWRTFGSDGFGEEDDGEPQLSNFTDLLTDGERLYVTTETMPAFDPDEPPPLGPAMTLVAVDPETGDQLWQWEISPGSTGFPRATEVAPFADGSAVAFVVQSGGMAGTVVVLDSATGQLRWEAPLAADDSSIAHVDGVTVVADGTDMRGYDDSGSELWAVPMPDQLGVGLGTLVVRDGRLFSTSYDVYEIDPTDGSSQLVREGVSSQDVVIAGDRLVMAAMSGIEAVPLPDPP